MKKIVSTLLSLAMVSSFMVAFATIASAEYDINVVTTYKELDMTEDAALITEAFFEPEYFEEGAHVYEITTVVSGMPASITVGESKGKKQYTGKSISGMTVGYKFSDNTVMYNDADGYYNPVSIASKPSTLGVSGGSNGTSEKAATQFTYVFSANSLEETMPYATILANADNYAKDDVVSLDTLTFTSYVATLTDTFEMNLIFDTSWFGILKNATDLENSLQLNQDNEYITISPETVSIAPSQGGGDDNDDPVYDEGYVAVDTIDGLTEEFAAKYEGKYFFTEKLNLAEKAATAHIKILRGEEAPKTIERDLATLLGIDAVAQPIITAGSIAVTVVTDTADVNPFTFVIE